MAKILIYQVYPFTWKNGLKGIIEHLTNIKELGATHVWISPLYPSPRDDMGYDIADYCKIDKRFGTMEDFDKLVMVCHTLGLEVLMDLVLNHTSTNHPWFSEHPEYYCWVDEPMEGWQSLFGGPAWEYSEEQGQYYCHLFAKTQADLDWFPDGNINTELVREFREIIRFWVEYHHVDGFRLDVPQSINKNFSRDELNFGALINGDRSISVLNALFSGWEKKPFLLMECFDPTFGKIVRKYINNTPVDYCMNVLLKEERDKGWSEFLQAFRKSVRVDGFALDLESHDSPRFTSRSGMLPRQIAQFMFTSRANCIVLYQGQELGLKNPELTMAQICKLDAQSRMQIGFVPEQEIKQKSRAYARTPLPIKEYDIQERDRNSALNWYKFYIRAWLKTTY